MIAGGFLIGMDESGNRNPQGGRPLKPPEARALAGTPDGAITAGTAALAAAGGLLAWATFRRPEPPAPQPPPIDPTGGELGAWRATYPPTRTWAALVYVALGVFGLFAVLATETACQPRTTDYREPLVVMAALAVVVVALVVGARAAGRCRVELYERGLVAYGPRSGTVVAWGEVASLCGLTQGEACEPHKRRSLVLTGDGGGRVRIPRDQEWVTDLAAAVYAAVLPLQIDRARAVIRRGGVMTCARLRVDAGGVTRPGGDRLEWRQVGRVALEGARFIVEGRDGRVWWRVNAETTPDVLLFAALAAELRFGGPAAGREFA
jgi:hypothetical protein